MAACSGHLAWTAFLDQIRASVEAELGDGAFGDLTNIPDGEFDTQLFAVYDLLRANGYFAGKPDAWDVIDFLGDLLMEGRAALLLLLGCVAVARDIEIAYHGRLAELAVEAWGDVMNFGGARAANGETAAERLAHFYGEAGRTIVDFFLRRPDFPAGELPAAFEAACIAGDPESAAIVVQRFANLTLQAQYPPERFSSIFEECRLVMDSADARRRYGEILLRLAVIQPVGFHGSGVAAEPYIGACAFADEHGIEHPSSSLLSFAVEICADEAISALIFRPDMSAEHVSEAIELDESAVDSAEMLALLQAGKARLRGEVATREHIMVHGRSSSRARSPSPDVGF